MTANFGNTTAKVKTQKNIQKHNHYIRNMTAKPKTKQQHTSKAKTQHTN